MALADSRYCAKCRVRWPLGFPACPACSAPTKILVGRSPTKSKYHAHEVLFERHYQRREERRVALKQLAPEAIGKREAQEIIALERLLGSNDAS